MAAVKPGKAEGRVLRAGGISPEFSSALAAAGIPPSEILAAIPADLSADGRPAERWLVIARDRLAVLDRTPEEKLSAGAQERFAGLTGIDYKSAVGGGSVFARRGEMQRELVRSTPAAGRAIQAALAKLRTHLGLEKPKADAEKKDQKKEAAKEKDKTPPPEALPKLSDEAARVFLAQLAEIDQQLYCPKCGLPLKQDSSVCPMCVSPGRTLTRILAFANRYRGQMVLLFTLLVVTIFLRMVPPYVMGRIFDVALEPKEPQEVGYQLRYLWMAMGAFFLAQLVAMGLRIWAGRIAVIVGSAVSRDLRETVFRHLQTLSLGYFNRHKTGALMTRVNGDTQQLQNFLVDGIQGTLVSLLEIVCYSGALFWLNWRLALLVVLPAPLVIFATKLVWKRIMQLFRRYWEVLSRMSAVLNDSLRGIRVVKAFGGERQEVRRFERASHNWFQAAVQAELFWTYLMPVLGFIMGMGVYLVMLAGGYGKITGSTAFGVITLGLIVQFTQFLPMIYSPLQMVTRLNEWLTRSMTAAERIFEILDTPPDVADHAEAVPMPAIRGEIELRDVVFGYEKHSPVIKHMSLKIAAGELVGLVGHSGAGKSTTINLITRLYDADEGQVLIDGVDIRRIRIADLRRQIGVVLQETFLFTGTVAENIAYGKPGIGREEVLAAARLANAHEFIMERPAGYDSEVEEGGNNFSAGEKQRLAIARAILHDPRILILDEATSSVDTKTEQQIQEALARLTRGRTTIAIAHRLSTLRIAGRLAVLEKGELKELGTHDELVAREGIYRDLVKAQAEMASVIAVGK